jgi:dipeptidyl-peptidase-4
MYMIPSPKPCLLILLCLSFVFTVTAQRVTDLRWSADGGSTIAYKNNQLVQTDLATGNETVIMAADQFKQNGVNIKPAGYTFSQDQSLLLVFTNTARVWRYNTRGDYWVYTKSSSQWKQVGKNRPAQSLMFAKLSPDGKKVAYVSQQNIYVEDLATGAETALTTNGNRRLINGTFDWVYEEEFSCRDGFRWSPDGKQIAYWQVDAAGTRDFYMINNTDSIYSKPIPVEYPKVGEPPSAVKIGVVNVENGQTNWMQIPGDPRQHYLPRMEWVPGTSELIVQQLNRKQNESRLFLCMGSNGTAQPIYQEKEEAWIDIMPSWDNDYNYGGWDWLSGGKEFLWASEKDGWRHLYRVSRDGKKETLLTPGNYDVMDIIRIDEKSGFLYFAASPEKATQKYLFRVKMDGKSKPEKLSPASQSGTHDYQVSPNGKYAFHKFSNHKTADLEEWISLPDHKGLRGQNIVENAVSKSSRDNSPVEYFTVKTEDGIEMDGWMVKPANFDPAKKYPVVFYVYSEPAGQTVTDQYGNASNFLYRGDMSDDGYFYISMDNRGTPAPKGKEWRKSIYRKIGIVNIRDQAMAAKELLKRPYMDTSRVAVWGWSGGGSATLNLMFQYPEIYKTGISIAAVAYQLTYDNIYQERYMGVPQENREDFIKGSPVSYAKNLKGNLLYIHGTGDDNVHYQNAELLINELVKYNKQFQVMPYPNRSHGLSEGQGTFNHLQTLYTNYLRLHCPPGGR